MTAHHTPSVLFGKLDGSDTLTDGTDLIHFQKKCIRSFQIDSLTNKLRIRDGKIVRNDLNLLTDLLLERTPVVPCVVRALRIRKCA